MMNNQTSNFGLETGLQPIILQSACNPTAKGKSVSLLPSA